MFTSHFIGELDTCGKNLATAQQEAQALGVKHEQTLSKCIVKTRIEELRECKTNLDAKQKEAEALRGQHNQTLRKHVHHII